MRSMSRSPAGPGPHARVHPRRRAPGHPAGPWDGEAPDGRIDGAATKLSRLQPGGQFAYLFDFGDDWARLCTVAGRRIDPLDTLGVAPSEPAPYFGWLDQYERRWDGGDGESSPPKRPARLLADLPPLLPCGAHANAESNDHRHPIRTTTCADQPCLAVHINGSGEIS